MARLTLLAYSGFPVMRVRYSNSRDIVPSSDRMAQPPGAHDHVEPAPDRRFRDDHGMPVLVLKAGSNLSPSSTALALYMSSPVRAYLELCVCVCARDKEM